MALQICPVDMTFANEFVKRLHRHHKPMPGCKFCIGCTDGEKIVGVLIAGRPVARKLDDGFTIEVNRCCTDGTHNACSILYGAAARAAKSLGYSKIITYTLPEEGGSSLKASNWVCDGIFGGGTWTRYGRPRDNSHPLGEKFRWSLELHGNGKVKYRDEEIEESPLFDLA